jgi:hypothetical protein
MGLSMEKSNSFHACGLILLALLALVLPFELKNPIFRVGPFSVTSVEVGIYLMIAFWVAGWLAGRCRYWTAVHTAVAAWGAAMMISACFSTAHTGEALKFALRCLGGCALFFAASEFVRSPRSAALVAIGLLGGSGLSAGAAFAEIWLPGAASVLGSFKTEPSMSGSYLRASSTFQYANIASMYWEATLALGLAFSAWWGCRRYRRQCWWVGLVSSIFLLEAIILSASRAGLLIAVMILIFFPLLFRHSIPPVRSLSLVSLMGLSLLCLVQFATGNILWLRLTTVDVANWYRATYEDFPSQLTLDAGKVTRVPLTIRNQGRIAWRAQGRQAVEVTYHWLDASAEKILIWDGARSAILSNVEPGARLKCEPWIRAPGKPGRYNLQWDMLQENMTWFSVMGPSRSLVEVTVLPSAMGKIVPYDFPPIDLPLPAQPARVDLWRAAVRMGLQNPLLGVGPDNFRRLYGSYLGAKRFDDRIYANDLYFELFATVGLIGLSAFLTLLVAVFLKLRTAWRSATRDEDKLVLAGIGMALAAYCIHGLVDYFLPFTPTYGLFWLLAGMAVGLERNADRSNPASAATESRSWG